MSGKHERKPFQIRLERNLQIPFRRVFVAKQFALREDSIFSHAVEIVFAPAFGNLPSINLVFDSFIVQQNHQGFIPYLAGLEDDGDEDAQNQKLPSGVEYFHANHFQLGRSAHRAETLFAISFIHDTVEAARVQEKGKGDVERVPTEPVLAIYSTVGFQKKLISELFRVFNLQ